MRNLQYKWGFAKKDIIKSQRQFMYGLIFYESDVTKIHAVINILVLLKSVGTKWEQGLFKSDSCAYFRSDSAPSLQQSTMNLYRVSSVHLKSYKNNK